VNERTLLALVLNPRQAAIIGSIWHRGRLKQPDHPVVRPTSPTVRTLSAAQQQALNKILEQVPSLAKSSKYREGREKGGSGPVHRTSEFQRQPPAPYLGASIRLRRQAYKRLSRTYVRPFVVGPDIVGWRKSIDVQGDPVGGGSQYGTRHDLARSNSSGIACSTREGGIVLFKLSRQARML
jgi:hypothetical protein